MQQNIVVIDYGMGNLGSIRNMLKKLGINCQISADKDVIAAADKLILPGVGAFDNGVYNLERLGLRSVLVDKVLTQRKLILGICLGMQLLAEKSEEGAAQGLGFVKASVVKFNFETNTLKIPHMGWNTLTPTKSSILFPGGNEFWKFYFTHSYHLVCNDLSDVNATTNYGYDFASAVCRGNVMGVQFHPEKSHKYGLQILSNFVTAPC